MDPLLEAALRRKELEDLLKEDPAARTRRQFRQYLEDNNNAPGYFGEPRASWRRREGARQSGFKQSDLAERYTKRAETSGVLDLLTLLPGAAAARAARAGSFGNAAVNALAFTSQFGDDPVSRLVGELAAVTPNLSGLSKMSKAARSAEFQKRLGQDYLAGGAAGAGMTLGGMAPRRETEENTAAFPVFGGVGTLGNLRRVAQRAATKGKDLPQFDFEGKIAPRRQQELEQRMRSWIPKLSGKDPEATTKKLDAWVKNNPFWGKYPLEKGPLLDLMPAELRQPFYQSLKEMGYGGTRMGERTALGSRGEKLGGRARNANFGEIPAFADRKWEDILKFEQGGGLPAGWAAANPGRQPSWIARPGEELTPGQRNFLDTFAKSAGSGGAAGALGAGILGGMGFRGDDQGEDDQAAVPGWKKALRAPYRKQMDEALSRRKRIELIPEKLYPLMEPDFNKVPVTDPWVQSLFKHRGGYYARPKRGNYELLFEGWPKAGLSIQRPEKFSWLGEDDAKKLKIDAYQRQNIPSIMKYVKTSEDRQKILEEFNKKHKVYRDSILNYPGFYGPQYEIPRMPETPWPDLETRFESNPRDLSVVSRILGAQFPEYENIGGYRVSGIRKGKAGKYQNTAGAETSVRLRKPKSEEDRLKTLVDSRRWLHELISAKGNTPAVMAVGRSAAPNPLGPVKNIFDFLGKPEDYFNLR